MSAVIAIALNFAIIITLCVSIIAFWRDGRIRARSVRRVASASSAATLIIVVAIYFGEFRRNALAALQYLGADEETYANTYRWLTDADEFVTRIVNAISPLGPDISSQPYPPLWPAILLVAGYTIRFLIYRLHTKKDNADAALTGSVYWNHITTYAMAMAFLIVVFGWNPVLVVSVSLVALAGATVSIKLWVADLGRVARVVGQSIWTVAIDGARWVAYAATGIAAWVRIAANYANRAYVEKIRMPLMARMAVLEHWNQARREASAQRLVDQDGRHADRFRRPHDAPNLGLTDGDGRPNAPSEEDERGPPTV